jgi:hypothetical protein
MPKNRIIYVGVVLLVATALLWIGAELTRRIEVAFPYLAGLAAALILFGAIQEIWRSRAHQRADRA